MYNIVKSYDLPVCDAGGKECGTISVRVVCEHTWWVAACIPHVYGALKARHCRLNLLEEILPMLIYLLPGNAA